MDNKVLSPGSPASSSSSNSSSASLRNDGLLYGSSAVCPLRLPTDDDLRYEGVEKLIQRLRSCENEHKKLLLERGRVMKDVNRRLQVHLLEVRSLKDMNQKVQQEKERLAHEKDELSGICCFLDDDREKAKKMAHEWQVFGRYATGVLQKELSQCQVKIRDLEHKQTNLLLENKNLKELCLLLDQEQAGSRTSLDSQSSIHGPVPGLLGVAGTRDSGDGSSNGSTASNCSPDHRTSMMNSFHKENGPDHRESYVRFLEHKVKQLEEEVKGRLKRVTHTVPSHPSGLASMPQAKVDRRIFSPSSAHPTYNSSPSSSSTLSHHLSSSSSAVNASPSSAITSPAGRLSNSETNLNGPHTSPKKDALAYAMKVLELHDQLDGSNPMPAYPGCPGPGSSSLNEQQKEIVREMCNVVWRKLGDHKVTSGKPPPGRQLQHRTASVSNL